MPFLLRSQWKKLDKAIWVSLEKRKAAPPDMYIELLRFARRIQGIQVDIAADTALSDPTLAREEFLSLPEPQSEAKCIELLEGYYGILREFKDGKMAENFRQELEEYVTEHNLRYTLTNDCKLKLSLQGLLVSGYSKLHTLVANQTSLTQALSQLEESISRLGATPQEERNAIGIATNLLEGIAKDKTTNHQPTLGSAIDGCDVFPHEALRTCVKNFYKFASDYPNIRHAGTPANKIRELKKDDAMLFVSIALAFGLYVFDNDSTQSIIVGDL
jgi:hypothetical protein